MILLERNQGSGFVLMVIGSSIKSELHRHVVAVTLYIGYG
jgi:hypothetical protein